MCCHFFGPDFWLEKSSFVQKISKKIKPGRFFQNRRGSTKVYTEIPLLLESSLDGFAKVVAAWFLFEILWQSEIPPHPNWVKLHPTPIGRPEENLLVVRCKLNCIQMGGESTLVMLEEREEVYRANSKLKHFRNESSEHYIGASYGPIGVSVAQQLAVDTS